MLSMDQDLYLGEERKLNHPNNLKELKLLPWKGISLISFVDPWLYWDNVWDASIIYQHQGKKNPNICP